MLQFNSFWALLSPFLPTCANPPFLGWVFPLLKQVWLPLQLGGCCCLISDNLAFIYTTEHHKVLCNPFCVCQEQGLSCSISQPNESMFSRFCAPACFHFSAMPAKRPQLKQAGRLNVCVFAQRNALCIRTKTKEGGAVLCLHLLCD